jgi:glycine/D-amino acid oxidase-like deaminating enzyme/nitrite reductase/ring-hydroxylating ferredoxin subunit
MEIYNPNPSLWQKDSIDIPSTRTGLDTECDVIIVGGGISGILTASFLSESKLKVVLIEASTAFNGVTAHTTGKLTSQHGLVYHRLAADRGKTIAAKYGQANQWAIQYVAEQCSKHGIQCDLASVAAYVFTLKLDQVQELQKEAEMAQELGLPAQFAEPSDLPNPHLAAARFSGQYRFHPIKFLRGMLERSIHSGVEVLTGVRVLEVNEKSGSCEVVTGRGTARAKKVVIATHYPIHDSGWFVAKLAPYRSYAMAFGLRGPVPNVMAITEEEPMHSFRKHQDETGDYLIVGGGHHKVGQDQDPEQNFRDIEKWARANFTVVDVFARWSTQDNWTPDGIPFIGRSPDRENIYLATGFGGWGMSTGIVAGRIIADQILGNANDWSEVFDPSRSIISESGKVIEENVDVAVHYVGDKFKTPDLDSLEALSRGSGGIVKVDGHRVAAYRRPDGNVLIRSIICTHMGCNVAWNSAEQSWDCPCHGSRFSPDGAVLQGPAVKPLDQAPGIEDKGAREGREIRSMNPID